MASVPARVFKYVLHKSGIGNRIAKMFWKEVNNGNGFKYLFHNVENIFDNLPVDFNNPELNSFLSIDSKKWSQQEEYVLQVDNVLIEPERCLVIKDFNKVVIQSAILNNQLPYILPYLVNRSKAKIIEEAVAYDGYASLNYYHHIVNAVNSIHMLDKVNLQSRIPFIINRACFNSKYFQYLYKHSEQFRKINWRIQEPHEWLKVKRLYRFQCLHFSPEPWKKTRLLYALEKKKAYRKVFLSRDSKKYGRSLSNEHEIIRLLSSYGFETVYAEHLSIEQQIDLFQTTKFLVALHGAGLVQQFFMNYREAHVIEILPKNYLMPLYYWQAYALEIRYFDIVVGDKIEGRNYHLEADSLKQSVIKMLNFNLPGKSYGNYYQHL